MIEFIRDLYSKEEWDNLEEQGRRAVIEDFFVNEGAF